MADYPSELKSALANATAKFRDDLQSVRSTRPSVEFVENIKVEAYGQELTVKELGSLSIQPPRDVIVSVWDKSILPTVAKAIEDAKMGLSVSVVSTGGNVIRASLPALSDERRAEIERTVKKMAEATRIQIRSHRDNTMKKIKAAQDRKELSEDQAFKAKEEVQKAVDEANAKVEKLVSAKVKELYE